MKERSRRSTVPEAAGLELVAELRSALDRVAELARVAELSLREAAELAAAANAEGEGEKFAAVERRLATAESDVKELASRLVESEHQSGRLMNLYVAAYQLHATLDPDEVQATIAEIAINLLGAAQFVLLLRKDDGEDCEVALRRGPGLGGAAVGTGGPSQLAQALQLPQPPQPPQPPEDAAVQQAGEVYRGGDPMVDATLRDGLMRFGPTVESPVLAAVPLRVQNEVVGALVLLKLLDHKPILRAEDRDLLDLLSAHAASALFAARLFAHQGRKLRTLESLVKLARGE